LVRWCEAPFAVVQLTFTRLSPAITILEGVQMATMVVAPAFAQSPIPRAAINALTADP
jgi:hypothetical protein